MPRSHPAEFRRRVLGLVESGRPVAEVAEQLGVSGQTIFNWRCQDLVGRGLRPWRHDCGVSGVGRGPATHPRVRDRAGGHQARL